MILIFLLIISEMKFNEMQDETKTNGVAEFRRLPRPPPPLPKLWLRLVLLDAAPASKSRQVLGGGEVLL